MTAPTTPGSKNVSKLDEFLLAVERTVYTAVGSAVGVLTAVNTSNLSSSKAWVAVGAAMGTAFITSVGNSVRKFTGTS